MKKLFLLLTIVLFIPTTIFSKTYLFEDYYYGIDKNTIEKKEELIFTEDSLCFMSKRYIQINDFKFSLFFIFDKKYKLKEVQVLKDLSSTPSKYYGIDSREYINFNAMDFLNSRAIRFLYILGDNFYFRNKGGEEFKNAIRNKQYIYYALEKKFYIDAIKKSDGSLKDLLNKVNKNAVIAEVYYINDCISIEFKLFRNVYKKGDLLYKIAQISN